MGGGNREFRITRSGQLIHIETLADERTPGNLSEFWKERGTDQPILLQIHGGDFSRFYEKAGVIRRLLIRRLLRKCALIVVPSDSWKNAFSTIVRDERIRVLPEGADAISDARFEELKPLRRQRMQILFDGVIGEDSGSYDLPQIIVHTAQCVPDVRFVLAGNGDIDGVRAMIPEPYVSRRVLFSEIPNRRAGHELLDEELHLPAAVHHGDVPGAVLEAMGYGLAVVATGVGEIGEIVRDNYNGYLPEPGDVGGITSRLTELLNDPETLFLAGENSLSIVRSRYSREQYESGLQKYMRSLAT